MSLPVATIDRLAFGGNGICRVDGKVCFVPYSCPGDEVSLRITSQKKSYCIASIAEINTASPCRAVPECSIFGVCGGCSWQHISYTTQIESKRNILAETLWRGSRVTPDHLEEAISAPLKYGYRSRLQFKVDARHDKLHIGFYRHGSHQVVDAEAGCPVAAPVINRVMDRLRVVLQSYPNSKSVSQISVDAGESGIIVIVHHTGTITLKNKSYLVDHFGSLGLCTGLFLKVDNQSVCEKLWGSPDIFYSMTPLECGQKPLMLTYPPGGFAQVNQQQNVAMLMVIRRLGQFSFSEKVLDLYCGNGNFSLPLATQVASVIGIEGSAAAILSAKRNKELNNIANIQFFCDDVVVGLSRLVNQGRAFDTVLLDPPRAGAGEAVAGIVNLKPHKIIYVSCDPSTLARDCGLFSEYGYRVVTSIPIDMFPQTYHIESVTLLCKVEKGIQ